MSHFPTNIELGGLATFNIQHGYSEAVSNNIIYKFILIFT